MRNVQRRGYTLLPVATCALLVGSANAEAAPLSVVAGDNGKATLAEVAGGGITFSGERDAESRSFRFNFPSGADQGPDTWYLIRLDASVSFEPGANSGSALLSGFSRGQAGAQVEFYPGQTKEGRPFVSWGSVDLIRGQAEGRSRGHQARVHYLNYLPYSGVRPGPASLTFQVESFGGARVSEIRIGPASGIYATPVAPVELKLSADIPDEEVLSAGKPARLEVEVTNTSARPAEDVVVALSPQASHMFVEGPTQRTIERLRGSRTVEFNVGRTRPGALRVQVGAVAPNGAEALNVIEAQVAAGREDEKSPKPWIALGVAALAVAGAIPLLRSRKQKGEKS